MRPRAEEFLVGGGGCLVSVEILEVRLFVEQEVDEVLAHRGRDSLEVEVAVLLCLERGARVAHRYVAE